MGILYREIVDYKHRYLAKLTFILTVIIVFVDAVMFFSSPDEFYNELEYIGYALMPVAFLISYILWQKCRTGYKYSIIDNELIISKIKGKKKIVELNLNMKQIRSITKGSEKPNEVEKIYNFTFGCKKKDVYRCIFEKEGKIYGFYFQPSVNLVSRIDEIIKRNNVIEKCL